MKHQTEVVVQLIHITGSMKGNIQKFSEGVISIGRHSSCHLRFPSGEINISRKHADIIKEGNKFKLADHSSNGTFINGIMKKDIYLKDGDLLEFAKGGPKVCFFIVNEENTTKMQRETTASS